MQFGDDWPGVFIRGDNAFGYRMNLDTAIRVLETHPSFADPFAIIGLKNLAQLLTECYMAHDAPLATLVDPQTERITV